MQNEGELNITLPNKNFKKYWVLIALLLILFFGFYLRVYHVTYPVIGYHNWKETHYLTEARNFDRGGFFANGFFIPSVDFPHINGTYSDPGGAHTDAFPMTGVIVGLLFTVFGPNLFLARFINILLSLSSIFLMYLVVKKLFKRKDIAIIATILMAINPLLIFFGRQVQEINPALFFGLLSIYFYLSWIENRTTKNIVLTAFFLALSVLPKYSFALLAIPMVLTFPYSKLKQKKYIKQVVFASLFGLLILFWIVYNKFKAIELNTNLIAASTDYFAIFTSNFWTILKSYASDNYTLIGLMFALLGLIFIIFLYKKNFVRKFILSYFVGSIIWFYVMSSKLSEHSYHQYPLVPLIIILISVSFLVLGINIANVFKYKKLKWVIITILFLIVLFPSLSAKDRMFDTQFVGLDLAGEYINEHSSPNERILFPGFQSYGVLWHADRKGYAEIPDESLIKYAENNLNVSWIFLYRWGLDVMNQPQWEYISQHYSLKQVAFQIDSSNGQANPVYFLLKKGGQFNTEGLNELLNAGNFSSKTYEFTKGNLNLNYISFN